MRRAPRHVQRLRHGYRIVSVNRCGLLHALSKLHAPPALNVDGGNENQSVPLVDGKSWLRAVQGQRHAQRPAERLEDGLRLVVRIRALQVVDVQGDLGVVDESLEELVQEIDIERAHARTDELHAIGESGTAGEIHDDPGEGFVQRNVRVPVAGDALLVADRPGDRLAERDAHILDGVVRVYLQVALGVDLEVDKAVPGHLLEHVLEEWQSGIQTGLALAIQV